MNVPKIIRDGARLLVVLWPLMATGAILPPEQAASIYARAQAAVPHYPPPEHAPSMRLVPKDGLVRLLCSSQSAPTCHECSHEVAVDEQCVHDAANLNLRGIQTGEEIYLDDSMDFSEPFSASVAYHEMIHYLQRQAKGDASSCQDWVEREAEAYREQALQMQRTGAPFHLVRLIMAQSHALRCQ
jgi:hypothetical protein